MTPKHAELWRRILEFPIDDGPAELSFVRRLARENGWSESHAERVVAEYRKFLFLAMTAGHPVTPSDAVDQAWHLHLTYSRSYWERLCREVLRRPLHHQPTQGGPPEQRKHLDAYARTLESYARLFGAPPPSELWPEPRLRFGRDSDCRRVNTRENWVVPRRGVAEAGLVAGFLAAGALLLAFGERLLPALLDAVERLGDDFVLLYWAACGAALAAGGFFRRGLREPDDDPPPEDLELHPYEAAYLAAGKKGAADAALAQLVRDGKLGTDRFTGTLYALEDLPDDAPAIEQVLHGAARRPETSEALRCRASGPLRVLAGRLRERGLLVPVHKAFLGTAVPLVMLAAAAALGVLKAVQEQPEGRPSGILALSMLFTGVAAAWMIVRQVRCSGRGLRVLKRLREGLARRVPEPYVDAEPGMAWVVGLLGLQMLSDVPWADLKAALGGSPSGRNKDGGGCGGCGGCAGCGGCGGCGG